MKNLIFAILLFTQYSYGQLPNDSQNSLVVCGDSVLDLDVSGIGTQELFFDSANSNFNNNCSSQEHNTLWLRVIIENSGTLSFTLTPESTDLNEDYDFFIFGPNVVSGNLGFAIRCSTTNPIAANQGNNLTGMNDTETDISEGPGPDGNSFVQSINVISGETYIIAIDRPIGDSPFNLVWTGTATFPQPPSNQLPIGTDLTLEECDDDHDDFVTFDLTQNEVQMINGQDVTPAYYDNISDALIGNITGTISIPNNYTIPSTNNEIVYIRLTDNVTSCFSVFNIDLKTFNFEINQPLPLYECSLIPPIVTIANFDFTTQSALLIGNNQNTVISYYLSGPNAISGLSVDEIGGAYTNITNPEEIWYRLENTDIGCLLIGSFNVEVVITFFDNPEPLFNFNMENLIYCEDNFPEKDNLAIIFDSNNIVDYQFLWSTGEITSNIDINLAGDYSVDITSQKGCVKTKIFHIVGSKVFNNLEPNFIDEEIYYCLNTFPATITLTSNIQNNNPNNFDYDWYKDGVLIFGDEDSLTLDVIPSIEVNLVDVNAAIYKLVITNPDDCSVSRTITVLPSEIATFKNVLVTENEFYKKVSIIVEVTGQGDYEYAIDSDDSYQDTNYFDNISYGLHTVYIRDKNGCGIIQEEITLLEYPKFITPNNDGVYDTWNINNINAISNNFNTISNITIFDRYGKVMANINPNGLGWDGNYLGNSVPSSDYWFSLDLIDFRGKLITKKGHFVLKRTK